MIWSKLLFHGLVNTLRIVGRIFYIKNTLTRTHSWYWHNNLKLYYGVESLTSISASGQYREHFSLLLPSQLWHLPCKNNTRSVKRLKCSKAPFIGKGIETKWIITIYISLFVSDINWWKAYKSRLINYNNYF